MEEPRVPNALADEDIDTYEDMDGADPAVLFGIVYRRLSGAVLGYLRARGVDDPEAVTQDVFLAFFPKIGDLSGGIQGAKSLVFSIAHARMVDHYRRRERAPDFSPYDAAADTRSSASAEDQALGQAAIGGASVLLEGLSGEHREVLALRVVADLSIEQVAGIMGKSPGAVKQLQRRALCNLRDQTLRRNKADHG
ncbi:RNA polymerase sigma factor [Pseudarthrobacter sp. N5]|uniref:RNA polymerase sigma factor n=1 Tax=Pseudarthrobacter sp. N5 TaxID=3418416 RepID=UPI003CEADACE